MKTTKKIISVLLSVIMMVSTCSVAFTTFAATESVIQELAEALKSDTVKNLYSYTSVSKTSSGSSSNVVKTNTTAITVNTYAEYKEIRALLEKLDAAVKDSDQYKKYAAFANDGSGRNCTDAGEIKNEITQSLLDSGFITAQEFADYNVATFLGNVLSMQQVGYTHGSNTKTKNNVPAYVYDITTVTTNDYKGYLAEKNSRSEVDASIVLSASYKVTMSRENYTTGSVFKTNHYHTAINTANGVPTLADGSTKNTEVKTKLNEYDAYLDSVNFDITYEEMLDMTLAGNMRDFYDEFKGKYDAIVDYVGGKAVFDKLFSDRVGAIENLMKGCLSAMDVETYLAIAEKWAQFSEANPNYGVYNYGTYDYDAMLAAYGEFCNIYNSLAAGGTELLEYLNNHGEISLDYYTNFTDNVKAYDLAKTADAANALYNEYKDTHADLSTEEQKAVYSLLSGYIAAIPQYSQQVQNSIFPDGYAYLTDLQLALFCETNTYVVFFAENLSKSFVDTDTEELKSFINALPGRVAGLNGFYNDLVASEGEEKAQSLLGETVSGANELEAYLYTLLADRFASQVNYADEIYTMIGRPTEIDSVTTFLKLKSAFVGLDETILSYLTDKGADSYISSETKQTYDELKAAIYNKYNEYAKTFGFSSYVKSEIEYEIREVYPNDKVKTEAYEVTEENLLNTIDTLDSFLASDTFKDLIGGKDIGTLLNDTLKGVIYTDKLINVIVNMLYPLVLGEFEKVWDTLPMTVEYSGMNVKVNYLKDLYAILHEGNLNIYPDQVAALLPDTYAEAKEALTKAGRNWKSVAIYDRDTSSLTLNWGVDEAAPEEKAEAFYSAFASAMEGLKPLVMALLCNQAWAPAAVENIATGAVTIIITITLNVALQLGATANSGYVNMLAPVLEALGAENVPSADEVENYTELYDVAKAIFEPIFSLVDKIAEKPVDSVISILPNLLYALSFDMVTPILNMLKTRITYDASANLVGSVLADGVDIAVGDMLDIKETFGLDLSKGLEGILERLNIDIPELDVATLATAGTLTTRDTTRKDFIYDNSAIASGKAYTIEADKADIAYYLLTYIADLLKDRDALNGLLSKFLDEEQLASFGSVFDALNINDAGDVAAAVVELLNQVRYDLKEFDWYNGTNYEGGTVEGTPALEIYLDPQNDWTKEKATYLYNNIEVILNSILSMAGTELDIEAELSSLISGLFTNKNITALAKLLGKISLDESISSLINSLVGVDLSAFAAYENIADDAQWGFDDGDGKGFASALSNLLSPVEPVLDFILKGSDIEITLNNAENGSSKTITLLGYDGYNSAVIPLLEALGCDVKALDENENVLKAVLDSLIDRINKLTLNSPDNDKDGAIYGIIELLPGVLYYLASNGLSTSIRNLLQPIYVILDTIRPVYDVDINELLKGLDIGVEIDIDYLDAGFAVELISSLTGLNLSALEPVIYDACKILGSEYESKSTLQSQWKKGAYSARFDEADMLTVIVSFLFEWVGVKENAEALDSLLGTDGIAEALGKVFESVEIKYTTPDWMYFFDTAEEFERAYKCGIEIPSTLASLTYPNNWTVESAQYIADNLGELGDMLAGLIDGNYTSLSALIKDKVKIYSTENVQAIADLIANLLKDIDSNLLDAAGRLLGVDFVGLSQYKAPEGIDTAEEFIAALTDILTTYLGRLVEWLLLGEDYTFFKKSDNTDSITINGAEGYAEGLALVLEAVGCENLPSAEGDTKAIVSAVLTSLFNRVDEIFENPAEEIVDLIPNLIYFLNADGATAAVDNVLSAVYALLDKLEALGVKLDISELLGFNIRDLSFNAIIDLVENLAGLDLTAVKESLIGFCVGKIKIYDSVSVNPAFMMTDFDRKDVITIVASIALLVIDDEDNAKAFNELLGDDIYNAVLNILNMEEVPVQEMSWLFTEYADTDKVLSAMESSELYKGFTYGPLYTEEMAQYIADNIGTFIDNIIYLLGIQIEGRNVDDLKELLNGLVNGSLYNSETAASIRDLIAGLVKNITQINGGEHIAAIVRTSLGVDLNAWDEMEFDEFENDRAKFTQALCDIVKPLYPVLNWLLSDEDFTFFVDKDNNDIITILGAEGYAYGIIPVLEVLGCENILTPAEYYAAAENDENVTFTAILNPLFDRLDEIMANPAEEILAMLPAVVYFINSNGLDTVVKNTLNAVYTLLNAIEPIAKVDLYEIIGVRLDELDFNAIFDVLIDMVAEKTGYEFDSIKADYIVELTMGKVVSYTSANGKKAYTMEYQSEKASADMVTIVLRLLVTFITNEKNQQAFIGLLQDNMNMSDDAAKYVKGVLETIEYYAVDTHHGMDGALATLYYVYFGIDTGADHAANGLKDLNAKWQSILNKLGKSDDPNELTIGNMLAKILDYTLEDIFDSDGLAPNGLIAFFQKIIEFFRKIIEWFKKLF